MLFRGQLEHEVGREAGGVTLDCADELLRGDAVEDRQIRVEDHAFAAQGEDLAFDVDGGQGLRCAWSRAVSPLHSLDPTVKCLHPHSFDSGISSPSKLSGRNVSSSASEAAKA